jgi:hypothetical protein
MFPWIFLGLARTICIWCTYGILGRDFTIYMVIYGAYIRRVGQNHMYTVYIRYFWQKNHQIPNIQLYRVYIYGSGQP